MTLFLSVDH